MPRPLEIEELLRHAGWLRSLARSPVHEPAAAEDLVQDTWLAAQRHPPGREPRAWLARVARNLAHNARRGTGRRTTREQLWHRSARARRRPSSWPRPSRVVTRDGETYTIHYQPDAGGQARIVGLRPDVLLTVEARDAAAQTVLAQDELVLAPSERRRLELRYGDETD